MSVCLAIGDLFVPVAAMQEGLAPLAELGYRVETAEFDAGDYDHLQGANLRIEKEGPASVPLDGKLRRQMLAAEVIVVHFCPIAKGLIDEHKGLKLIGTCRTGTSNIDTAAAKAAGVPVVNCRGRLADAVADFTVGMMICEARNIARGHHGLKAGQWRRRYHNLGNIPDLPGRTVGLVGLGAIGQAVARRLAGFDMTVLAYDPFVSPAAAAKVNARLVPLDDVMRQSDFVSIHVDVRPETMNLIGAAQIAAMKPTAYFINTARAGVVNEPALIDALAADRIAGAAIDVYDHEPLPPGHPYLSLDNVTLTPHMAGGSDDAFRRSPRLLCGQIIEALRKSRS